LALLSHDQDHFTKLAASKLGLCSGAALAENSRRIATVTLMLRIISVETDEAVQQASVLFREYAASLGVDLSFQNFEDELALLPGDYAAPDGRLVLAVLDEAPPAEIGSSSSTSFTSSTSPSVAGCIALRKIDAEICEMKRLYVRPEFRGHGAGRALAGAAISAAREIGYRRMRLDTLPQMTEAQALYRALGFREIAAYRHNPVVGTRYFELEL
jgi:putative acetyltransferase